MLPRIVTHKLEMLSSDQGSFPSRRYQTLNAQAARRSVDHFGIAGLDVRSFGYGLSGFGWPVAFYSRGLGL